MGARTKEVPFDSCCCCCCCCCCTMQQNSKTNCSISSSLSFEQLTPSVFFLSSPFHLSVVELWMPHSCTYCQAWLAAVNSSSTYVNTLQTLTNFACDTIGAPPASITTATTTVTAICLFSVFLQQPNLHLPGLGSWINHLNNYHLVPMFPVHLS